MHNLLTDPLIRAADHDGAQSALSLPQCLAGLTTGAIADFPALRPHQRHAWHAFLVQLAALALHGAGRADPPENAAEWTALLRALTPDHADDAPWRLVTEDAAKPAFLQPPAPKGFAEYKREIAAADDLDLLVTSKNHDVKQAIVAEGAPEDWLFALVSLQTMAGFLGAGNYGVARMNGGFSARPCLGLAPAEGGIAAHVRADLRRMLAGRDALLAARADFRAKGGHALLWTIPWDGGASLDLRDLDPWFIELCRRVRLFAQDGRMAARAAPSKAARIAAKELRGNLGDFWTPIRTKDSAAYSVSDGGFPYGRLKRLFLEEDEFAPPPAMRADAGGAWRLVARGVAGGQGKTEGYYERTDIILHEQVARALFGPKRASLAMIAQAQLAEIEAVTAALRFGVAVAASGGKDAADLDKNDRAHAGPWAKQLDARADALFFSALQDRFLAEGEAAKDKAQADFVLALAGAARDILRAAAEAVPCRAQWRPRAVARAELAFEGRLRGDKSAVAEIIRTAEAAKKQEVSDAA